MKQRYLSIDQSFLAVEREQLLDEGRDIYSRRGRV